MQGCRGVDACITSFKIINEMSKKVMVYTSDCPTNKEENNSPRLSFPRTGRTSRMDEESTDVPTMTRHDRQQERLLYNFEEEDCGGLRKCICKSMSATTTACCMSFVSNHTLSAFFVDPM